ncbi:MAG TPA: TonB-dependent receptor [Methylomirabilota bacterium]|nr:TonB-dependent receptor [Methylomirabilota bacterium]
MASSRRIRYRVLTFLAIAAVTVPTAATAQTTRGAVSGRVTGPAGAVLADCRVSVEGTNLVVTTGTEGRYRLISVPAGEQTLIFEFMGLQAGSATVTVVAGETVQQDMTLAYGGEIEVRSSPLLVGQAKALNQQKNAINISNIVAADQIGRFPDKNAAEATERIPAVSLLRDQGEGRYVIVRGTEPRLNSTTINGERIPSPEAGERSIALDTIPSDLLGAIEVSKALTPEMDGDSIGGTINLVTQRAPEELRVSAAVGTNYNDLTEEFAGSGNFSVGKRFGADKDWGVLVSGSASDSKRGSDNIEPEYDEGELDVLDMRDYTIQRERYGVTGDFDYRASLESKFFLRGLWTNYIDTEIRRAKGNAVGDDELERATRDRRQESFINSLSGGGEHMVGASGVIDYRLTWNRSSEETPNQVTAAFIQEDVEFDPNVGPDFIDPTNIQANPLNEDPSEYWFDELQTEYKKAVEEDFIGALNYNQGFFKNFGFSGVWKVGAKARLKSKEQNYDVFDYESDEDLNFTDFINDWESETPFFRGRYGDQITPFQDPEMIRELLASGVLEGERNLEEDLADFDIDEDTYAAYGMTELLLGAKTAFLGGVRVESTSVDYRAYELVLDDEGDPMDLSEVVGDKSYTEWLPQFHLVYKTGEESQLRAAVTRSLARPNFEDMAPWRLLNLEDMEIELGNPDLDVTTAWNLDLMWEQYLQPIGIFSVGLFYKDLTDYIYLFNVDEVIGDEEFEVIQPRNGDKGNLWGLELAYQNNFTSWPGAAGGFGIYANYTYIDSEAEYPDREPGPLPGQSEHVGNFALVYEKYGISTRISYNFNGKNVLEVGEEAADDLWVDDHAQIDFLFRYQFTPKFSVVLEAVNITNEPYTVFEGIEDRIRQQEYYGWWATLGVRFDL